MRLPLRNQILLPMLCVTVSCVATVSIADAWLSVRHMRQRVERELRQTAATLSRANFPLNDDVLRKMRGLSGADFVLCDPLGNTLAASSRIIELDDALRHSYPADSAGGGLGTIIAQGERRYFHTAIVAQPAMPGGDARTLHILYPEETYREAWREAATPPLIVGGLAALVVALVARRFAWHVTAPLGRLQGHMDEIARGQFHALHVPTRDDEIADLTRAVNRMSAMLAQYEADVRRSERSRTLLQLGSGIAHQLRNAATGCRMALDLHAAQCEHDKECLQVARRQLQLMESYLRRFMSLGSSEVRPHERLDLREVVAQAVELVMPSARHLGIALRWQPPAVSVLVDGDGEALGQVLVNLLQNGVEAASAVSSQSNEHPPPRPQVNISIHGEQLRALVEVSDTGQGPSTRLAAKLFEPFVTDKPDGVGLGLAVAREIVLGHRGALTWRREGQMTVFRIELPLAGVTATAECAAGNRQPAGVPNIEPVKEPTGV